ncbi:MAG: DciA family protein [Pseudomonadales bacterium]|nr:DciA family protein [Pseudomonadales bacterium]
MSKKRPTTSSFASTFPKTVKDTKELLSTSRGSLKNIINHAKALLSLQSIISDQYPHYPADEIRVASLNDGHLELTTASAASTTRIKYSQQTLISALRRQKPPHFVDSIAVSVRPQFHTATISTPDTKALSDQSAQNIAEAAKYIEDEPLRKALIRLADRKKRPTNLE